jgi:hypothetical protein
MKKKHSLSFSRSHDYEINGIISDASDIKLCFQLNHDFQFQLKRDRDLVSGTASKAKVFPFFSYYDKTHRTHWYLIANRNQYGDLMIQSLKHIPFFLINTELPPVFDHLSFLRKLKQSKEVRMIVPLSNMSIKGISNLLDDLEIHLADS